MRERTANRLDRLERDLYELKCQVMQAGFGVRGPIQGKRYDEVLIIDDPVPTKTLTDEEKARIKAWVDGKRAFR